MFQVGTNTTSLWWMSCKGVFVSNSESPLVCGEQSITLSIAWVVLRLPWGSIGHQLYWMYNPFSEQEVSFVDKKYPFQAPIPIIFGGFIEAIIIHVYILGQFYYIRILDNPFIWPLVLAVPPVFSLQFPVWSSHPKPPHLSITIYSTPLFIGGHLFPSPLLFAFPLKLNWL